MARVKQKKLLKIIVVASVLLLCLVAIIIWNNRDESSSRHSGDTQKLEDIKDEGVEVPEDLDPSLIKDYQLVTENEQFKIRKDKNSGDYLITLYAIINRPGQADLYNEQLKEYKQNALQYLKNNGVNTSEASIEYEPSKAADL